MRETSRTAPREALVVVAVADSVEKMPTEN
jgi:hypothetical protein